MAKKLAVIFGIVFVIVGILGFIPNPLVGTDAFFETDAIHNIVHLAVGVVLLIVSRRGEDSSALWLKVFGVVYLVLFVDGLINPESLLGFVSANANDTWLHLALAVALLVAGFAGGKSSPVVMMDKTTM